jgi:hypothetical protein
MKKILLMAVYISLLVLALSPSIFATWPPPGYIKNQQPIDDSPYEDYPWNDVYSNPTIQQNQLGYKSWQKEHFVTENNIFGYMLNSIPSLRFLSIYLMDFNGNRNESRYHSNIIIIR